MAMIAMMIFAIPCRLAIAIPIAAVNGPPVAAPKPAFAMVEAVFKVLRWEMVLVPTSIASSNPDDSVAIFKCDPFLVVSAEVSVRWIRCRLLFHHQHRMVF